MGWWHGCVLRSAARPARPGDARRVDGRLRGDTCRRGARSARSLLGLCAAGVSGSSRARTPRPALDGVHGIAAPAARQQGCVGHWRQAARAGLPPAVGGGLHDTVVDVHVGARESGDVREALLLREAAAALEERPSPCTYTRGRDTCCSGTSRRQDSSASCCSV